MQTYLKSSNLHIYWENHILCHIALTKDSWVTQEREYLKFLEAKGLLKEQMKQERIFYSSGLNNTQVALRSHSSLKDD